VIEGADELEVVSPDPEVPPYAVPASINYPRQNRPVERIHYAWQELSANTFE
jgi:hypothetical protein